MTLIDVSTLSLLGEDSLMLSLPPAVSAVRGQR
jgi:hypothetical protein